MRQEKPRQRPPEEDVDVDVDVAEPTAAGQQRREKLNDDLEATLDEIDDVLEENAENFVRSYIQKGGE